VIKLRAFRCYDCHRLLFSKEYVCSKCGSTKSIDAFGLTFIEKIKVTVLYFIGRLDTGL